MGIPRFRSTSNTSRWTLDAGFPRELETILGRRLSLPRVSIGERHMGGVEEIRLHKSGELKRYLEGLPEASDLYGCCEGLRFILCYECDSSHKCYKDKQRVLSFNSIGLSTFKQLFWICNRKKIIYSPGPKISGA